MSVVDFYEFISLYISMCWFLVCFEALCVAFWHWFTKSASPDWVQSWSNSSMMDQSSEAPQLPCDIQNPPVIPGEYVFGTPKSAFLMRHLGSNYLLIRCLEAYGVWLRNSAILKHQCHTFSMSKNAVIFKFCPRNSSYQAPPGKAVFVLGVLKHPKHQEVWSSQLGHKPSKILDDWTLQNLISPYHIGLLMFFSFKSPIFPGPFSYLHIDLIQIWCCWATFQLQVRLRLHAANGVHRQKLGFRVEFLGRASSEHLLMRPLKTGAPKWRKAKQRACDPWSSGCWDFFRYMMIRVWNFFFFRMWCQKESLMFTNPKWWQTNGDHFLRLLQSRMKSLTTFLVEGLPKLSLNRVRGCGKVCKSTTASGLNLKHTFKTLDAHILTHRISLYLDMLVYTLQQIEKDIHEYIYILALHSWFTIHCRPASHPPQASTPFRVGASVRPGPGGFNPTSCNIVYAAVSPSWDTMRVPSEDSKIGKWRLMTNWWAVWFEHLSKVTMSGFHISARIGKAWKSAWNPHENLPETMIDTISRALQLYLLQRVEQCKSKIHLT